ncbi:HAD-IIIA family hydrolase [Streptomyces radicis]|uniref:D,D-heptose 1,7-bisphosphate phosphatase n=2 Tax=Streptomyces radicis TaxID=1750517 RepID=A0A3A9VXC4_9ACTN|nr:HAD-IIIA family hydrolase [Streptomyces radicis]RKN17524.1 HAD-IIIA family hydrolase [Streptomyces radicis]
MSSASIPTSRRPPAGSPPGGPWMLPPWPGGRPARPTGRGPDAVLFDRDGTLIEDVPYNADPELVRPLPGAREALDLLRARNVAVGVVSNQSGAARGRFTRFGIEAVRRRMEALLGPFDVWAICPHAAWQGCQCRKPAPGLVYAACGRLGVSPRRSAVIGDIGTDMAAAHAAGARGVLVPTPVTRRAEIAAARECAPDLLSAVRAVLATPEGRPS